MKKINTSLLRNRFLAFILALSVAISYMPRFEAFNITAQAADEYTCGDYKFTVNSDGTATITDYMGTDTDIIIPSTVMDSDENEYVVSEIGRSAFYACTSLTSIEIPDSVTSIGRYAFYDCDGLTSVTIPDGVTSIEDHTFDGCSSLTSVVLGESVTSIGYNAFSGCTSLTSIDIPDNVTSIDNYAFDNCKSLTSITLPDSVSSLGARTFSGCINLKFIFVDENNKKYASRDGALYTKDLKKLLICPKTKSGEYSIPYGVVAIESFAFLDCAGITSITLPDSMSSLDASAFSGCINLKFIFVDENNEKYASLDGILYTKDLKTLLICPRAKGEEYTIPNGVTTIDDNAFSSCTNITSVNIPDSVTTVGAFAFSGCSSLKSVSMSKSVTSISYGEFLNCANLSSITIPDTVTSISNHAFYGCEGLTNLDIPENLTSIGGCSFINCTNLNNLIIPETVTSLGDDTFNTYHLLAFDKRNTISVYSGSYAEAYAIKWSIPYNIIGVEPFKPTDLIATPVARNTIKLSWTKSDVAAKYNIYRSDTEKGEKKHLGETAETTYLDTTAQYGKTYYYFVTTIREDGGQSDYSDYAVVTLTNGVSSNTLSGKISSYGNTGIMLNIQLLDSNNSVVGSTTSTDGTYSFDNITVGENYTLSVSAVGCVPVTKDLTGSENEITMDVEIRQYGDIFADGVIDAKDATQILRYEAGLSSIFIDENGNTDEYLLTVGKVLKSDELTAKDATQILRYEAGMTSVFDTLS